MNRLKKTSYVSQVGFFFFFPSLVTDLDQILLLETSTFYLNKK